MSRSWTAACNPRSRASSVTRSARIVFGTVPGGGLYASPSAANRSRSRSWNVWP